MWHLKGSDDTNTNVWQIGRRESLTGQDRKGRAVGVPDTITLDRKLHLSSSSRRVRVNIW